MVIKNLTCKSQKLIVKEIIGEHREYDMIFQPHSTSDLDRLLTVVHPEKYAGIFEFDGYCFPTIEESVPDVEGSTNEEDPDEEDTNESTNEVPDGTPEETTNEGTSNEEKHSTEDKAPDSFICDICGAEFASARGLASHKNKAHSE